MKKENTEGYIIVLDTNILLELYRKSADMAKFILDVLTKVNLKLWIPHQVIDEYEKNEQIVRKEQCNKYKNIPANIKQYLDSAKAKIAKKVTEYEKRNFPNIGNLKDELNSYFEKMELSMKSYVTEQSVYDELCKELFSQDIINDFVKGLKKQGKVGERLRTNEYLEIIKEGELRYKYKIPPGYMDDPLHNKDSIKKGLEIYGDLILWKQILKYAKDHENDVILVTEDRKEDWYINGIPRNELIQEFYDVTGKNIKIYRLNDFIDKLATSNNLDKEDVFDSLLTIRGEDYYYKLLEKGFEDCISDYIFEKLEQYDYRMLGMKSRIVDIKFETCDDIDFVEVNVTFDKVLQVAKYTYELVARVTGRGIDKDYYNMPITFSEILQLYVTFTREIKEENRKLDLSNSNVEFTNLEVDIMFAHFSDYDFDDSCIVDERY